MRTPFIKRERKRLGLSQGYLASKLGMTRPTYSKVERGNRPLTMPEAQQCAALFNMTLDDFLNERAVSISVNIEPLTHKKENTNGDIRISIPQEKVEKFEQALLYILKKAGGKPNVGMTVLYKLLYFIDFDYYEKYEEQLLGLTYIKNHYGPTPIIFEKIIQKMIEKNQIEAIKSKFYQHDQKKFLINPDIDPNLKILNGQEIEHIDWELDRLSDLSARTLSDLSHKDIPWISAENNQKIEYESVFYRTSDTSVRDYSDEKKH